MPQQQTFPSYNRIPSSRPCRRPDPAGVNRGDRNGGEPLPRHLQMGRQQHERRGRHRGGSRRLHLEPVVRRHSPQAGKNVSKTTGWSMWSWNRQCWHRIESCVLVCGAYTVRGGNHNFMSTKYSQRAHGHPCILFNLSNWSLISNNQVASAGEIARDNNREEIV